METLKVQKTKDSKTETFLGPLLISGSGFVKGFYRMTYNRLVTRGL